MPLGDETVKIFLNSKGDKTQVSEDLRAFLNYIDQKEDVDNDFVDALDREVQKARENKEWRLEYMTLFMKLQESLEAGKAQGLEIGRAEGRAEGELRRLILQVRKKYDKGISAEETAEMLEETPVLVTKIMDILKESPELTDEEIYEKIK